MAENLKSLETLRGLGDERIDELRRYREKGVPVIGYFDIFTSPELISSCGAIPLGLQLGGEIDAELAGEKYMKSDACAFCKVSIGYKAMEHPLYECVTHLVGATTCDQMRRMHELWHKSFHIPVYVYNVPSIWQGKTASRMFDRETSWLKSELEILSGTEIKIAKLRSIIEKYNTVRHLLKEVERLVAEKPPRVSGSEILELIYYYRVLDIDVYHQSVSDFLQEIKERKPIVDANAKRIVFGGSHLAHRDYEMVDMIQKLGATIVFDFHYHVQAVFMDAIDTKGDIWENLCESYRLPKIFGNARPINRMYEFLKGKLTKYHADAVIYKTLKFCDPWTGAVFRMKKELDLPFLHIDSTYSHSGKGQLITRIEAFLEML